MVGASRARAVALRAPTAEELYSSGLQVATGGFEFGNAALGVETAQRVELGMHLHRGPFELQLSAWQARYDDFVYLADTDLEVDGSPARVWRQDDARFTGFGIVFLAINLYTRFFEHFWDRLSAGAFFLIAGALAMLLGYAFERQSQVSASQTGTLERQP